MEDVERTCSECGHPLQPADHFCPECGHAVDVELKVEEPDAAPPKRTRLPYIIAAVAAVGLVIAGAAWWGLSQRSAAKEQYQTSAPVLVATLDDMSGAQSTEVVQEVAGTAQEQVTAIDATLDADPNAKGADQLTTLRDAFAALAALQTYKETNTMAWSQNREELVSSLDTLTSYGGDMQIAAAQGEDAVRTLDDLTRRVDKAMDRYRKQVRKAKAQARDERNDVRGYHEQMESLIDQYTGLRNDTGAFVDSMYDRDLYMFEVVDYFTQAATDRRQISNRMAALKPPGDMRGVHQRIVTVIGDGADAIDSAVAALEDADCYDGTCYFEFNTQWEQFQSESDRITAQYGDAYDNWQAQMSEALKAAKGADLPPKPDL